MSGGKSFGFLAGLLVGLMTLLSDLLVLVSGETFGEVAIVVALHLQIKDLGLRRSSLGNQVLVQQGDDIFADLLNFSFDLGLVGAEEVEELRAFGFFLLLDSRNGSPGGSSRSDPVLVGNAQKVPFFVGQFAAGLIFCFRDKKEKY